ncbi:MAG: asparagine--tRNA ligase, partial [Oscillospiraceae bacterium]|nr:asparagine--tRNA ligase [Oscillospiraceae bacterium]
MQLLKLRDIQREPEKYAGAITVCGWVRTVRIGKAFGFIELNDGTSFRPVQVVFANDERALGAGLTTGCAIIVEGTLVLTPDAPQPFEVHADAITIEGACPSDYPMQKKRHTLEYLRTMQTLRPRTNTFQATFRVRSVIAAAIHEFFQERGFVYVHTPILTNADCEGRGEMFQVTTLDMENLPRTEDGKVDYSQDFFKKPVHLSGSGQLYGEAFALAFRDIYTFGPTFRAEYSFTPRHASEFWMIEPEMAFCDLEGDMEVAEAMVKYIIQAVL